MKKEQIKTNSDVIRYMSQFRPEWTEFPWHPKEEHVWEHKNKESFIQAAKEWIEKQNVSHEEWNRNYVLGYLHSWSKPGDKRWERKEEELNALPESEPIGGDEYITIQCGTSRSRAELFVQEGEGYVTLEKTYRVNGTLTRTGIQVSELGGRCRSGFGRLRYYATNQASKCFDEPAILVASIKKKYVYGENNAGEYAIPRALYKKLEDVKILTLSEYSFIYGGE